MKLHLLNTSSGLIPMYDYDFDEKEKVKNRRGISSRD